MFAPSVQTLAHSFASLDNSIGSIGNPWLSDWTAGTGITFLFPPLEEFTLFRVVAKALACAHAKR